MKKILLLTSRLPYPPIGGDKLKNYNLLKILSKYYNVYLVTVTNERLDDKTRDFLKQYTIRYKVFEKSKIDFLFSASNFFINREPLQVNYYYFNSVQQYINMSAYEVDIIISTLVRTSKYVLNINKPKIFDMADSLGQNYVKSLPNVTSIFWRFIYNFESKRLIPYEEKTIKKFDKTFLFNREEIKFFNLPEKIKFIPHGVNKQLLSYKNMNPKYMNSIAFFGKMDYQPNIDAVLWFTDHVLERLDGGIEFIVVGANPTRKIEDLSTKYSNIKVTGFVDDPYEILNSCLCIVAPMQTGAGIQNKILETMALGTINIVSSLAANPIGANDRKDYIILDEPSKIANEINNIFHDPDNYMKYKIYSKKFIENNFTWSIYEKHYISTIEEVLNDNKK